MSFFFVNVSPRIYYFVFLLTLYLLVCIFTHFVSIILYFLSPCNYEFVFSLTHLVSFTTEDGVSLYSKSVVEHSAGSGSGLIIYVCLEIHPIGKFSVGFSCGLNNNPSQSIPLAREPKKFNMSHSIPPGRAMGLIIPILSAGFSFPQRFIQVLTH